jgi:hypothetical protein
VLLLMQSSFHAHKLWQLAVQVGTGGVVYGVGLLWAYRTKRAFRIGELIEKKTAPVEEAPTLGLQDGYRAEI